MALQHEPVAIGNRQRKGTAKKEAGFRAHLAAYLGVGAFLLTLNILTSPFHLWFYWPLFFWGWGLVWHAFATYGTDAPARVPEVARSLIPRFANAPSASRSETSAAANAAPFAAEAFAAVHERIERLKETAWTIDDVDVRGQVEAFCSEAERTVASMARDRTDAATVRRFDAEYLAPVASLLDQYLDAERRHDPNADKAARRIAERDLPLVLGRLDKITAVESTPPGPQP